MCRLNIYDIHFFFLQGLSNELINNQIIDIQILQDCKSVIHALETLTGKALKTNTAKDAESTKKSKMLYQCVMEAKNKRTKCNNLSKP